VLAVAREQGYRAPELTSLLEASIKTDVYSLGTIILELLTGRSPSKRDLPRWVASVLKKKWTSAVFDVELRRYLEDVGPSGDDELMGTTTLALQCVDPSPSVRPQAREVLQGLERIRPGPENATGQSQHSSPEDGAGTNENHSPLARNKDIHTIEVAGQPSRPQTEQPEQVRSPLEDGAGLSEHQSPLVRIEAQEDAFEQLGQILSTPEDDTVPSEDVSPVVPIEPQAEVLEQIRPGTEDGAGLSGERPSPLVWPEALELLEVECQCAFYCTSSGDEGGSAIKCRYKGRYRRSARRQDWPAQDAEPTLLRDRLEQRLIHQRTAVPCGCVRLP
jgi:serine/threonine protein kinase